MTFATGQNLYETVISPNADLDCARQAAKHFSPAYDRILIRREISALEQKTKKSGIILTDQTKDAYQSAEGYLVGYGPTASAEAKALLGKRILFSKYTGDDIVITMPDGSREKFILATDKDIYGELK